MILTPDDIAKFEELDQQRERVLAQGYTVSQIPINANHEKWIEYKRWKQSDKSPQPAAVLGNEHTAGQLASLSPSSLVTMPHSTIPNQFPNMMNLLHGAAAHNASFAQASAPESHLCTQAMVAHGLLSGAFCCLADHHHPPSFPIGAPSLAHGLSPARPHGLDRISANSPGTKSRVIEILPRTTKEQAVIEESSDCEDEAERESTEICLYLGKTWRPGISADVYRNSSDNWISEKLLRDSNNVVEPGECPVAYQVPGGTRLESKGCVKVDCRLSLHGKTLPGEFQVYTSRLRAPHVILGKSWVQKHGAAGLSSRCLGNPKDRDAQRRPGSVRFADTRRTTTVSQSVPGHRIMKLPQRHTTDRDAGRSRW